MSVLMISSCRISHFGMNPVSGGSPPSDSRVSRITIVDRADLFHRLAKDLILVTVE